MWKSDLRGESSEVRGHTAPVRSVQFSPDNQQLVSAADDKTVRLWSVQRSQLVRSEFLI